MHEYRKEAREGAAKRLKDIQSGEPHTKVDSSSWSPPEMLEADKQTGMRPVSPRQYKSGGKVHGVHAKKRADRKARKEGGRAMSVDGFINRDDKMANDERKGVKHVGGMKRGGKIKREHHADGDIVGRLQNWAGTNPKSISKAYPNVPSRGGNTEAQRVGAARQNAAEMEEKAANTRLKQFIPFFGPDERDVTNANFNAARARQALDQANQQAGYKKGGRTKHAKGGAAKHPDEAEDKALIRKMVKPSARTGKAEGGSKFDSPTHSFKMKLSNGENTITHNLSMPGESAANALVNAVKFANKGGWNVDNIEHTGSSAGAGSSAGLMKRGGRTKRDEHCWGGEAKSKKADGGKTASPTPDELRAMYAKNRNVKAPKDDKPTIDMLTTRLGESRGGSTKWIQGAIKHPGSLHKALHVPAGEKIPAKKLEKAAHSDNPKLAKKANLAKTLKRMHHADGGEAGRGLYVRQGYPHEVPGADGGRTAKRGGGSLSKGKGKTNVNIMIHPHSGAGNMPPAMPPMGGPMMPPPPPPRPQMPPMGGMPMGAPMGAPPMMPPMGAARPGMPPIGRKSGGKVEHVIDHAAGGGLGRLEKIKAYGLE